MHPYNIQQISKKIIFLLLIVTFMFLLLIFNQINDYVILKRIEGGSKLHENHLLARLTIERGPNDDRLVKLQSIDDIIKNKASSSACKQPNLPINSPEIMKFVHDVPKIDCSKAGEDWVKCTGFTCSLRDKLIKKYGNITCQFTDVIRVDDFKNKLGKPVTSHTYDLEKSDVVNVECKSSKTKWSATLMGIRKDQKIWDRTGWTHVPKRSMKLNVLMFGFDSLSRNSFIRKLPKSYEYLTKVLGADVLKGYNIVGDGTPQALIPILTGKTELELPDTRKRLNHTKFVNIYPFIWNDFKDAGYVTGFFEDVPDLGTFTYRLNGFNETPTDHYMREYYVASFDERNKWPKLCTGEIPRHQIMFNAIKDLFRVYKEKPKFLFGFHGELSHDDYNLVGVADDDLLHLLTDLKESGALNNTLLIVMADHGHRFAEIRNTLQGKQEERLPFFSFTFPKKFQSEQSGLYANFKSNLERLTTPFDIYKTLKSVLENIDSISSVADISKRSVSLFSKIPDSRSCAHAYIEPHWCACLEWQNVSVKDPIAKQLGDTLVKTLNDFTANYSNICERLKVSRIDWVMKMNANQNLIKFNKNADLDGFVADLTAKMVINKEMYQVKAMLTPGDSLFEASITHNKDSNEFQLKLTDVSRINMYGSQARCVEDKLPQLRKYCYCKSNV